MEINEFSKCPESRAWGCCAVIINNENKIYLGLRHDGCGWGFPGGGIEQNETPYDAIIREIKEETGLTANSIKYLCKFEYENSYDFVFLVTDYSGNVKIQEEEVLDFKWVDIEEYNKLNIFKCTAETFNIIKLDEMLNNKNIS